jgi:hypothetical protein
MRKVTGRIYWVILPKKNEMLAILKTLAPCITRYNMISYVYIGKRS